MECGDAPARRRAAAAMQRLLAVAVCVSVVGCGGAPVQNNLSTQYAQEIPEDGRPWYVKVPAEEKVVYRGAVNYDSAGLGNGTMLYPAPDALSFVAAIVTHGLLLDSQKKGQKDALQEAANKVLDPFQPVLRDVSHGNLMRVALPRVRTSRQLVLAEGTPDAESYWRIEVLPVFSMTQDRSALIADTAVQIYPPGKGKVAEQQYMARVVATPVSAGDPDAYWLADDGKALREVSASLLAESLDMALSYPVVARAAGAGPEQTVRYREGASEKMERGEVLAVDCRRILVRNLRGWLMSLPPSAKMELPAAACSTTAGSSP